MILIIIVDQISIKCNDLLKENNSNICFPRAFL